jgi:hypothetical protein
MEKQAIVLVDSWSHAMLKIIGVWDTMNDAVKFVEGSEIPDEFTFCIVPFINPLSAETLFFAMKEKDKEEDDIPRDPLTGAQLSDIEPEFPSPPSSHESLGNLIDLSTGKPILEDDPQHPDNPNADRGEFDPRTDK